MTHEFNSDMFPRVRALGNASGDDEQGYYQFQKDDALRGKNKKGEQQKSKETQKPKPQGSGK